MTTFTTDIMNAYLADEFVSWFDAVIGTETEMDRCDDGVNSQGSPQPMFSVTCFEITGAERRKCQKQNDLMLGKIEHEFNNDAQCDVAQAQRNEIPAA